MFTVANVCVFHTHVEPISSGEKTFTKDTIDVDINELCESLIEPDKFVVVSNCVEKWSELTKVQNFIITDELVAEEGFDATFVMSHFGRSVENVTNRKIKLSFKLGEEPTLKATYYAS